MSPRTRRVWQGLHTWSSLVCTVLLLLVCVTGLPLVFSDEIDHWLDHDPPYATLPLGMPRMTLDSLVAQSLARYPGQIVTSLFVDDDEPRVLVRLAPSWRASVEQPASNHFLKFDARTGKLLKESEPPGQQRFNVMRTLLRLHTDLFADLAGGLCVAAIGLLFVLAIVSGVALYGPFTKKLDFGTVRTGRTRRLRWLDLHNLIGITTLAWTLVVAATGILNELSLPLFMLWQKTDVQAMLRPWQGKAPPQQAELASVQSVFDVARQALPGMRVQNIAYPGNRLGSPHHYLVWGKGNTPLTSRLVSPVLVDARSATLTAMVQMPWYLRALEVSRPLHFGDYGGLPLKIIWALLDVMTIVVLGSGVYLWFARRSARAPSS